MLNTIILLSIASLSFSQKYVENLDLNMYMGRWYQVYKDKFDMTFQGQGTCAVADYALTNTNVTVLNSQFNKNGSIEQIDGYAFYEDGNIGGDLSVVLNGGAPGVAPYWVIELGPIINDQYQYSVVSDDKQISLFVLARNVEDFFKIYNDQLLDSLKQYGFTRTINKPIIMSQENCNYTEFDKV